MPILTRSPDTGFAASFAGGAVAIVVEKLDLAPAAVRDLAACLDDVERERAARCRFERERRRFVVARARLRELLAQRLDAAPASIEFVVGPYGKPALAGKHAESGWHFNLSHCDDLAVYAFARGRRVGVDVEAIRAVPEAEAVAAHFFSARERAALLALEPGCRLLGFYNCWTRKEAFVKAQGGGLRHPPYAGFDVSLAPGEPARILRVGRVRGADAGWRMDSFSPMGGFVAALVCERRRTAD